MLLSLALGSLGGSLTSCNDWLDLLPNNEQVTDEYWQSKEDVESVVASGYYYMREAVPTLINWGELRGGDFYNSGSGSAASKLQDFDLLSDNQHCQYGKLYQVISMANSVLMYAPEVQKSDRTYYDAMMKSHLCEAYFQRAYAYSILVKNFKEVPLVVDAYVNDKAEKKLPKASESRIIGQIKSDIEAALATGAAKGTYETEWQTKGRATKWALYALMADICLWNHEYDLCVEYADKILKASDAIRPVFISETANWFDIFYPGLSNESIFELYWDYNTEGSDNNFSGKFPQNGTISGGANGYCNFTQYARNKMELETMSVLLNPTYVSGARVGRMMLATYTGSGNGLGLWKYRGTDVVDAATVRVHNDANFILYRVADVMMMKAEALTMMGQSHWTEAVELVNAIRNRAGLIDFIDLESTDAQAEIDALDELTLLSEVLEQREMEFLGEAHRWYDLLRMARYDKTFAPAATVEDNAGTAYESYKTQGMGQDAFNYKTKAIEIIALANETTNDLQIASVLQNGWAWYLPLPESDILSNENLKQNPYYE